MKKNMNKNEPRVQALISNSTKKQKKSESKEE